jgi:hypothetical protein
MEFSTILWVLFKLYSSETFSVIWLYFECNDEDYFLKYFFTLKLI